MTQLAENYSTKISVSFVGRVCLIAAMGGLLFGYDWVVIGGAKPFYEPYLGISGKPLLQGWAMSSALVGCLVGAALCGALADRFGRKRLLQFAALLFIVSAVTTAIADGYWQFNAARWVGGVGIGLASSLSPMYIAEVAPAQMRGRFVSVNQLTIVLGILAAQIVNLQIADVVSPDATEVVIRESWNGSVGWRYMFAAELVPAMLFLLFLTWVPESPRWLIKVGRDERAAAVLQQIGGTEYAESQLAETKQTLAAEEIGTVRFVDLLDRRLLQIVGLGVFLAVFQQWCGINVIFNYAQEVFTSAGYDINDTMFNIVVTGVVNLAFTVLAIFAVDRLGRRMLMIGGAAGLALIYAVLGAGYFFNSQGIHMLLLVVMAIACYAMTLAPVTWVVISEIFPNRIRGVTMSIAVFSLWAACTLLTITFPWLRANLGACGAFWLYGSICLIGLFVISKWLPETKGKSLEDIERVLLN